MANIDSTTSTTPIVQNVDRPFAELFELLPQLNAKDIEYSQSEVLQAINIHASNAAYVLLSGIQSLGELLAFAADYSDNQLTKKHVINIAWLTHALGNLLESCVFARENAEYELAKQEIIKN